MTSAPFDDKTILKRKLWIPIGAAAALALAGWVVALSAISGKDLLRGGSPADSSMAHLYVIMALFVTILAIPVANLAVRKIQILLARGAWTQASVESISSLSKNGTRPVTFSYRVSNQQLRITRDVPGLYVKQYRAGSRISIVYDPQNPKRCHPIFRPIG